MIVATARLRTIAPIALVLTACVGDGSDAGNATSPDAGTTIGRSVPVPAGAEAVSFLGDTLLTPEQPEEVQSVYLERYAEAEAALGNAPEDVDSLIWMGRRTAYLGRYREAIGIYTRAIELHPEDARLYRHRGHRYLTVRELDNAIADFEQAAALTQGQPDEVEPDGLPNARGVPTSTLQFNIWYHLGLAHYVKGDLEAALQAYRSCMEVAVHPDSVVATAYWLYMTLRRLGRDAEAAELLETIEADMDIIESVAYLDLLLLHKGERTFEEIVGPAGDEATLQSTTAAYGLGVWHLLAGRAPEARATFERILTARNQWSAFGYVASEGELARERAQGAAPAGE